MPFKGILSKVFFEGTPIILCERRYLMKAFLVQNPSMEFGQVTHASRIC